MVILLLLIIIIIIIVVVQISFRPSNNYIDCVVNKIAYGSYLYFNPREINPDY